MSASISRRSPVPAWLVPAAVAGAATLLAASAAALGWRRQQRLHVDTAAAPLAAVAASKAQAAGVEPGPAGEGADDLKVIEGIGPHVEAALLAAGVDSFDELAALRPGRLRRILKAAGGRMADPATWPEQARLAASGRWRELAELQGSLSRGRRRRAGAGDRRAAAAQG
ncbi:MAG: hypothetical protein U0869_11985 [Chloroflexota bacterium]